MALKYTLKSTRIEIDGPENYIEVRGLSLNDIVQLLVINREAIEVLFEKFSGRDVETINESEVTEIGMGMIEKAPGLVGHVIALAADALEQFEDVMRLPVGTQIAALEKIGELTFASGGGPKKMLALAMKAMRNGQSESQ